MAVKRLSCFKLFIDQITAMKEVVEEIAGVEFI